MKNKDLKKFYQGVYKKGEEKHYTDFVTTGTISSEPKEVLKEINWKSKKVLDVGCGPGIMAMELVKRDCDFWGMDLSLEMLKQGNKIFGPNRKVHFFTGTAENLCFSNNAFDAVISMGVIEFVNNDELAIKEMIRVLQPGGILIVAVITSIPL